MEIKSILTLFLILLLAPLAFASGWPLYGPEGFAIALFFDLIVFAISITGLVVLFFSIGIMIFPLVYLPKLMLKQNELLEKKVLLKRTIRATIALVLLGSIIALLLQNNFNILNALISSPSFVFSLGYPLGYNLPGILASPTYLIPLIPGLICITNCLVAQKKPNPNKSVKEPLKLSQMAYTISLVFTWIFFAVFLISVLIFIPTSLSHGRTLFNLESSSIALVIITIYAGFVLIGLYLKKKLGYLIGIIGQIILILIQIIFFLLDPHVTGQSPILGIIPPTLIILIGIALSSGYIFILHKSRTVLS
jgi:hypothetical protein